MTWVAVDGWASFDSARAMLRPDVPRRPGDMVPTPARGLAGTAVEPLARQNTRAGWARPLPSATRRPAAIFTETSAQARR